MVVPQTRYRAFLSYSHALDARATAHIQDALQTFARPWYKPRNFRVFRDQTNLGANPQLWPTIRQALDESAFLILVASPEAARSKWIDMELRHWLGKNPSSRLLIVLTAGNIVWDPAAGDFDWTQTTALPRLLAGRLEWEPLYVDLTWLERDPVQATLRNPRFLDAIHTLAAPLHGLEKDEIASQYARQRRHTLVAASTAVALVLTGAVVSIVFAVLYHSESLQAARERDIAITRLLTARAERFLQPSRNTVELAALLSASAADRECRLDGQTAETISTLQKATALLAPRAGQLSGLKNPFYRILIPGPDPASVISVRGDGAACSWSVPNLMETRCVPMAGSPSVMALVGTGRLAIAGDPGFVELYDWQSKAIVGSRIPMDWRYPRNIAIDAQQEHVLVSGGSTGYLIDVASATLLATLTDHPLGKKTLGGNEHLLIDVHGRFIATTSGSDIILWTTKPRDKQRPVLAPTRRLTHEVVLGGLEQSSDGRYLATFSGRELWVWNTATWERRLAVTHPDTIVEARFSPDGRSIASGSRDGTVHLVDVPNGNLVATARHFGSIRSIRFSPNSESFVTASEDGTARIWRSETGEELKRLIHAHPLQAAVPTADAKFVVTLDREGNLAAWDISRLNEGVYSMGGEADAFFVVDYDVFFTMPGHLLRTTLPFLQPAPRILASFGLGHPGSMAVAVSGSARRAAFVDWVGRTNSFMVDFFVRMIETDTGRVRFERSVPGLSAVSLSGDARWLAAAAMEQNINGNNLGSNVLIVWDTASGREVFQQAYGGGEVSSLVMSGRRRALALVTVPRLLSAKASVSVWDVDVSRAVRVVEANGRRASVVFLDSTSLVAIAKESNALLLLDVQTGQDKASLEHDSPVIDVAKSPDESRLLTVTARGELWIWKMPELRMETRIALDSAPSAIAFSAASDFLAVGTAQGSASIFDLKAGRERWQASLPGRVGALAFSADGSTLLTTYRENLESSVVSTMKLWKWRSKDLLTEACTLVGRDLRDDEWNAYVGTGQRKAVCKK